jgi:signal transduction histidine kinase
MDEHEHDLAQFIESDPRGKGLRPYLRSLADVLSSEREQALSDLERLQASVEHIIHVVSTQQAHAGPSIMLELASPQDIVEEALLMCAHEIDHLRISVVRNYEEVAATPLDKQRLLQILVNLIRNAVQAMERVPAEARKLTLAVSPVRGDDGDGFRVGVEDAGEGIAPQNLSRIFAHGFTTRESGHGFGLHSSALTATELGGKLTVHSDGLGRGAIFTVLMPLRA